MTEGYTEFEFDLPDALLTHLIRVLDGLQSAPLAAGVVGSVPEAQGVYQLFLDDELVYIGKTDAEAGLRKRLDRHAFKIQHRLNLDPARVTFRAVRIFVFTAIDLETQLIRHYAQDGARWNNRGFGANDPGRQRDRTKVRATNFDALYPIDLDRQIDLDFSQDDNAGQVLARLKQALPYTFRYQTDGGRRPAAELAHAPVKIGNGPTTTRRLLLDLVAQLPAGWQVTAFLHQIILYRETIDDYPDAQVLARS